MIDKVKKLASIFNKKAQVLPLGGSTTSPEEAFRIGQQAKFAFEEIDRDILQSYPHKNFEMVVDMLSSNKLPDSSLIREAVREFNSGIKYFSNMVEIPFEKLIYVMQ